MAIMIEQVYCTVQFVVVAAAAAAAAVDMNDDHLLVL